jgi:hypothetical protein
MIGWVPASGDLRAPDQAWWRACSREPPTHARRIVHEECSRQSQLIVSRALLMAHRLVTGPSIRADKDACT